MKEDDAADSDDNRLDDDADLAELAETKAFEMDEKRIADEVQRQVR